VRAGAGAADVNRRQLREIFVKENGMILENDPTILNWVINLERMHAGNFLRSIGLAAQYADMSNYALMRPLLADLMKKYPKYSRAIRKGA
jgi:hypothetical protein